MAALIADLRYAARTLGKSPAYALVAILTLTLGIGANTAIFSFIDGVLLKPLPYGDPERILMLSERPPRGGRNVVSTLNFLDWKSQSSVFESITGQAPAGIALSGVETPLMLRGSRVSASFFDVHGVSTAQGRTFAPGEDQPGQAAVAVISYKCWQERFGGAPGIVGRQLTLNSKPHTVIGVLPKDSAFDRTRAEIWVPLVFEPRDMRRNYHWFRAYARLKPGVTLERATAEMNVIAARIAKEHPDTNKGWGVTVDRLMDRVVGDQLRSSLLAMLAAVGAVLLIGCANLANLTLARATSREKEVAVRAALGAGRWRLARQFLTENLLLSLLGGTLGLAAGYGMVAGLKVLTPPYMLPPEASVEVDVRVMVFTFAISTFTSLLFGAAPALQAASPNLARSMREGGRGATASPVRRRLRSAVVVTEMALSFILLTGAGLLIRSFEELQRVNMGVDTTNVLTMGMPLTTDKFKDGAAATAHVDRVLSGIQTISGVRQAAVTSMLPLQGWGYAMRFQIAGRPPQDRASRDNCFFKMVSTDYFSALGIQIRRGRVFTATDRNGAQPVAVINQSMARRFFKDEDPVGKRILVEDILFGKAELGPEVPWEIIGVIADEKINGLDDNDSAGMYVPYAQTPATFVSLVVKGSVNPETLQQAIRHEVQQVDRDQPLTDVRTLEQLKNDSVASNRLRTTLLGVFATIALALAAIGIYGVFSYSVAQRTHEMGVRLALGASRASILGLILRNGLLLACIGVLIGLAGALALTRFLQTLLFGVSPTDPTTLIVGAFALASVGLFACYIPARRATAVDPLEALREE